MAFPPQGGDASWTPLYQKTCRKRWKCYSSESPQGISPKLHEKVLEPKNHSSTIVSIRTRQEDNKRLGKSSLKDES